MVKTCKYCGCTYDSWDCGHVCEEKAEAVNIKPAPKLRVAEPAPPSEDRKPSPEFLAEILRRSRELAARRSG